MNTLEAEYSFLAPTWRLPAVATTSMYPRNYGAPYLSNGADVGPDWPLWSNTMHNSRYVPSYIPLNAVRRNYPIPINNQRIVPPIIPQQQNYQAPGGHPSQPSPYYRQQFNHYGNHTNLEDGLNLTISLHPSNEYDTSQQSYNNNPNYGQPQHQMINRGLTYATNGQNHPHPSQPNPKRHVQIIDHNRQTPSTSNNGRMSSRNSHISNNSYPYAQRTPEPNHSQQKHNPPPQVSSISNQRRDYIEDDKHGHNGNSFNVHEYLYGLSAPDPGSYVNAYKNHQRRLQDERVGRKSVMSDYKNFAQNGGFGPSFANADVKKHGEKIDTEKKKKTYSRVVRETNQYKLDEQKRNSVQPKTPTAPVPKLQRAREYAEKIEKPHHLKPVSQRELSPHVSTISPILTIPLSNIQRRASLDSIHSLNQNDLNEYNINRLRRSASLLMQRRVRFRRRESIQRRSSTLIDLPSHIIGKSIPHRPDSLSIRMRTQKSISRRPKKKDHSQINNSERLQNSSDHSLRSTSNKKEKKIITSHSMTTNNTRLPPTATVVINQQYKPSLTATTNNIKKSLHNIKSSDKRSLTAQSIPVPFRNTSANLLPDFDFEIQSFCQNTPNGNNSSNQ